MSDYANLSSGTTVPVSGNYKCEFCGEGGLADIMRQGLRGSGMDTPALQQFSNQSSQRYFEKGNRFTECPTCGPATGWSLISRGTIEQPAPAKKHGEVVSEKVVCDVCGENVLRPSGYLLTTRQVVSSTEFWEEYYNGHKTELRRAGIQNYNGFRQHAAVRENVVKIFAQQSNPWMVCDSCINKFDVDVVKAQDHADRWWADRTFVPPGSGRAPSSVRMKPKADRSELKASLFRGVIGFLMCAVGSVLTFLGRYASEIADKNQEPELSAITFTVGLQVALLIIGVPISILVWKYIFREKHGYGVLTFWLLCLLVGVIYYFA